MASVTQLFQPSIQSIAHRARLSALVSSLRRVRPHVPFYRLPAHRIPTLWHLYRGLLRLSPSEDVRCRIRWSFRRHRHLLSPHATEPHLRKAHKWLDIFKGAHEGNRRLRTVLARYVRLLAVRHEKGRMHYAIREELAYQRRPPTRPLLTGGYMRATPSNGPLPRMRGQPLGLSMMIRRRREQIENRIEKTDQFSAQLKALSAEAHFERALGSEAAREGKEVDNHFMNSIEQWKAPIVERQRQMQRSFDVEAKRAAMLFPWEVIDAVKQARREKIEHFTDLNARERKGEVFPRTLARKRKGPPAKMVAKMTKEQLRLDKIRRSVSEVGYVAMVKRRLGVKMREPEKWKEEMGREENQMWLTQMEDRIRAENQRRRVAADDG